MGFDIVYLKIVMLSELFVTDRADTIPILPDMPYRLPLNLLVYLSLMLLEVEVLCEEFVAYFALKLKHFYC